MEDKSRVGIFVTLVGANAPVHSALQVSLGNVAAFTGIVALVCAQTAQIGGHYVLALGKVVERKGATFGPMICSRVSILARRDGDQGRW